MCKADTKLWIEQHYMVVVYMMIKDWQGGITKCVIYCPGT